MSRSKLNALSDLLYRGARLTRDVRAVQQGRIVERVANRWIGRLAGRVLRKLWR